MVITSTFDFWSKRDIVVNALKIFLFRGNTQIGGVLCFFIYVIAYILEEIIKCSYINRCIEYLSIHSMSVIGLHFLAFKVVNLIVVGQQKMPFYMVAVFPTVTLERMWWIAYMIAGIVIPLVAANAVRRFIYKIQKFQLLR